MDKELADLDAVDWPGLYRYRIRNFLRGNFTTMAQLLAKTPEEVLREPGFGRLSLNLLEKALAERGLHLATWPSREPDWWRATLDELT